MNLEQIRSRIAALQEQINQLAAELPEEARICYGTRYQTEPNSRGPKKELVITVTVED